MIDYADYTDEELYNVLDHAYEAGSELEADCQRDGFVLDKSQEILDAIEADIKAVDAELVRRGLKPQPMPYELPVVCTAPEDIPF